MQRSLLVITLALICGSGCQRIADTQTGAIVAEQVVAAKVESTASATSMSTKPTDNEQKAFCLAASTNNNAIDTALTKAQMRLHAENAKAEHWVATGREWIRKARYTVDPGFYLNADGCATVALQLQADYLPAQELHSLVLINNHQFAQARELAEQLLKLHPDNFSLWGTLSDAALELGDYELAATAEKQQMRIHPGMAANARAFWLHWLNGDNRSAKLFLRDALQDRSSSDPEPAAWLFAEGGMMFWREADYAGAQAFFNEALKWIPDYPAALTGMGRIEMTKGNYAEAIKYFQSSVDKHAMVESAWLLGDAYQQNGHMDRAQAAWQQAEKIGLRSDKLTLGQFWASKDQQHEKALAVLEEERQTRAGIQVDDAYAWALFRAGRAAEAMPYSEQAMKLKTQDAKLMYHAGAIQIANGQREQGRQLLARALALNPQFDTQGSREAQELLRNTASTVARN